MRKFFITGGTGLIGRALVRRLLAERESLGIAELALLTRNPARFTHTAPDIARAEGVRLIAGDMAHGDWPHEAFSDFVHGATDVNDMLVADRSAYAWQIAQGTQRTLEYAKRAGCERYLYLSSGAVYGPGPYPAEGIPEHWAPAPQLSDTATAYGQAKRFSEHLCALAAQPGFAVRIARIFSVIGPESPLEGQYALGSFIRQAAASGAGEIRIKGDGLASRSYLHVDDVADWLIALHERAAPVATFNIGSSREVSIRELAELISRHAPQPKAVIVEGTMRDYAGRSRYFPDTGLIRSTLAVAEARPLEAAVSVLLQRACE